MREIATRNLRGEAERQSESLVLPAKGGNTADSTGQGPLITLHRVATIVTRRAGTSTKAFAVTPGPAYAL